MKRTILDYFTPKRFTRSSPPYPIVNTPRKEFDFATFYRSSNEDYPSALAEMKRGHKTSHWIWYILPQLGSLGSSSQAIWYGIKSIPEAKKYLEDSILGPRLIEICEVIYEKLNSGIEIRKLMGGGIDSMKLLSCITLFYFVAHETQYEQLFTSLRIICENKLKRQDNKTILFCEESFDRLQKSIPISHQNVTFSDELIPALSQTSSISSSQPTNLSQEESAPPSHHPSPPPSLPSYPVLYSTRIENDFTLYYRYSPHRYQQILQQLQSKHSFEYSPWLWYLLPQLVPSPPPSSSSSSSSLSSDHPNSFYFYLKSFLEAAKFYQDPILGFQLMELFCVIYQRLDEESEIEKVVFSRENGFKLLSSLTLFSFISQFVEDSALSYLQQIQQNEIMKQNDFTSPKELIKLLKKICEELLLTTDEYTERFCEESLKMMTNKEESKGEKGEGESKEEGEIKASDDEMGEGGCEKEEKEGMNEREEKGDMEEKETVDSEENDEDKETDDAKDMGMEEGEGVSGEEREGEGEEEEEEGVKSDDHLSLDSDSHEYNEYSYQLEMMELQTRTSPPFDDTDLDEDKGEGNGNEEEEKEKEEKEEK